MAVLNQLILLGPGSFQWALLLGTLGFVTLYYKLALSPKRARLPVYSTHSGWFGSWYDSLDYLRDSPGVLKAGYEEVRDARDAMRCSSHLVCRADPESSSQNMAASTSFGLLSGG
jgi:hypothetical protein